MSHAKVHGLVVMVMWLLGSAVSVALCMPLLAISQSSDEADLRTLAEKFFAAYQKEDLDGIKSLWSDKSPDLAATTQTMQQSFAAARKIDWQDVSVRGITVDGKAATVRAVVEMTAVQADKPGVGLVRLNRTFHCVKNGGDWKIWRYVPSENDLATALVAATTEDERNALLATEKELVTVELVRALLGEGDRYFIQGNYAQALAGDKVALSIAEQLGDQRGISGALNMMAAIQHSLGSYAQSLEYLQKAQKLATESGDKTGIARALNGIGIVAESQGSYAPALESYHKSLKLIEELGDKDGMARVLNNIGIVHRLQANYLQALESYQKSLKLVEELGDRAGIASTLNNIGIVHQSQGNNSLALEYYQKSRKLFEELRDQAGIVHALNSIGIVYFSEADYPQALEYHLKSLKIAEELGGKEMIARTLNNIGRVHSLQDNYTLANACYKKSLELAEELGLRKEIVLNLIAIGKISHRQGDYAGALQLANRAATIAEEIGSPEMSWSARTAAGKAYSGLGQPNQARQAFSDAINSVEGLRAQVAGGEGEQQRYFEIRLVPYYAMVDLLIGQNKPAEALTYAERAKGRVLLDVLRGGKVNIAKAMTRGEQDQEQRLIGEMVSLNAQLYREKLRQRPDENRLADLNARLPGARMQYEAFQTNLYAAHPELKAHRGDTPPLSLNETGALIPATTVLLEFVVMEDKTHLFVLTRSNDANQAAPDLMVYTLNIKQKDLADRAQRFRQRLASHDFSFRDQASQLYDLLLKPARAQLQNKTTLVIVPDGVLWELPFQALQRARNRYLIEDYAISYAPSLTVLREMMKPQANQPQSTTAFPTLLAFGNPAIGKETAERVKSVFMDEQLLPLPEAERQVRMLGRLYGAASSKVYVGTDAREDRAKLEARNCRILHLATHGILNNASPMYSHLVLSQPQTGDEDGLLEAWEIMNLELKADLVVLSACDTARGRVGAGEGVIGLAWALFVAGCPTIVASQWKVESSSTTELMVELHRNLKPRIENPKSRITKSGALRLAALKLLRSKRYRHPFYWAGFVMIGDGR